MLSDPARRRHDRRRMMAADIVKRAQLLIGPANDNQRLPSQVKSKKLSCSNNLVHASNRDPVAAEYLFTLQAADPLIHIPRSRNRRSILKRRRLIVERQHVSERRVHNAISSLRAVARTIDRCPRQYT